MLNNYSKLSILCKSICPISRSAAADVPDDYVDKLKMELERCLMSNKTKRSQVAKLQTELRAAKTELNDLSPRCERAEKTAEELKVRCPVRITQWLARIAHMHLSYSPEH